MSTDPLLPTMLTIGVPGTYSVNSGVDVYADFTELNDNTKAYGVYITNASGTVSPKFGYWSSTYWQDGSTEVASGTGSLDKTIGFVPLNGSTQNYLARVSQATGAAVNFDIVIREGIRGSGMGANPMLAANTPTWIGANWGYSYFDFTATAAIATLDFSSMTSGINIDVVDNLGNSVIGGITTNGAAATLTRIQNLTGLIAGNVYTIQITSLATSGASVGQLNITSP